MDIHRFQKIEMVLRTSKARYLLFSIKIITIILSIFSLAHNIYVGWITRHFGMSDKDVYGYQDWTSSFAFEWLVLCIVQFKKNSECTNKRKFFKLITILAISLLCNITAMVLFIFGDSLANVHLAYSMVGFHAVLCTSLLELLRNSTQKTPRAALKNPVTELSTVPSIKTNCSEARIRN
ncbi:hypothetical protein HDU92_001618 [Lobulomyces angularis]|nr:hypothetical protein HDU92_001618 [Lobulomyces angularis]